MELAEIIAALEELPPEKQHEAGEFIASLRMQLGHSEERPKAAAFQPKRPKSFRDKAYFGVWRDRPEMPDPAQWLRELREQEWNRHPPQ